MESQVFFRDQTRDQQKEKQTDYGGVRGETGSRSTFSLVGREGEKGGKQGSVCALRQIGGLESWGRRSERKKGAYCLQGGEGKRRQTLLRGGPGQNGE